MTDSEIAGIMGWRGPGCYTEAQMRKARQCIEQAVAPYREDAERYRWLKAQNETDDGFCVCDGTLEIIGTHPGSLDAAIDAARKGGAT